MNNDEIFSIIVKSDIEVDNKVKIIKRINELEDEVLAFRDDLSSSEIENLKLEKKLALIYSIISGDNDV